tara:strand:- start:354 stop:941 length:588 start_codon:yes stop_codon:yes gene_type:complete
MPVTINGNGHISGLAVGGLPNGSVNADTLASNAVTSAKLHDDAVVASKLPAGSIVKYQFTTSSTQTNITSTTTWTTFTGTQVDFTPTFSNSQLDITWSFALEANQNANGIGFRIFRQSPIGGSNTQIAESYQHSHWGTGNWTGPGDIVLNWNDSPGVTTPVRYYVQSTHETGNALYINAGSDPLGITMRVMEIKQ